MDLYEAQISNPDLFRQFSLKDTLFLHYSCPQREKVLQLYSKYIQFNFTLSGKRILKQGNHRWVATPDNGLIVKKCAFMQELPDDYQGWDVLIFYLRDHYLRSLFEEFRPHLSLEDLPAPNKIMFEPFAIDDHIKNSYQSFIPYILENKTLPDNVFENKFKELLFNILSHPDNKHILAYIQSIAENYQSAIWEVMEANYMYNLKIRDFATIANRSLSTFKREFKEHYNTTPGKWLTERRLQRAESMLKSGNKSVGDIAFDCGFKNTSHFSRVFREQYGLSPSGYQKKWSDK
ncbi:helix-turn-helix domain-containing protein [Rhodohalobacter mucosus]|uniref:AraC family transcriptional regulator n=1 Tax=Rhodohalobacter mucosus TaxID=2079485 RepID=A0A316TTL6_9BACT|nr:AraC family transcriptional regulator [Rhodohalobacter mucosus]PWN07198.1 AraC family transcriptional regulator [Rhodohalobacter mucosus]